MVIIQKIYYYIYKPFVENILLQRSVPQTQQELVEGKIWFSGLIVMFLCCLYLLASSKRDNYWNS